MATGLSVHIGVNVVDPDHYGGWSGPLNCCEADADVMHEIAEAQGFQSKILKTVEATRDAVADAVRTESGSQRLHEPCVRATSAFAIGSPVAKSRTRPRTWVTVSRETASSGWRLR